MSINADRKKEIIKDFATNDGDTGSPEVQVAVLTERIKNLTEHFNCLLYTSPSPRDLDLSRMPSSA